LFALMHQTVFAADVTNVLGNDACQALLAEGNVFAAKREFQNALNKYLLAAKADPTASTPFSSISNVLFDASRWAGGDNAMKLRQQAEAAARKALQLASNDPLAEEILRAIQEDQPPPLHVPSQAAQQLESEGEVLFQSGNYADAQQKYEQAAQVDPLYSTAWVFAGDCFYRQNKWAEAETRFRKATEIEPLNGQAWRFFSDALAAQGKRAEAESALLNGIAAQPSQLPNWDKLTRLRAAVGFPLTPLQLVRKAQAKIDPSNGKSTIVVDPSGSADDNSSNLGVWLVYAAASNNAKEKSEGKPALSSFEIEIAAWRAALAAAAEIATNSSKKLTDPGLLKMQMLAKENQLEPAVFLLIYKESYRSDFEAWKKMHPNGVKKFVDAYGLRP
ncbi:MAG TPA: tetratricopeptide repeat protein, partial [Burkholderiaceae bacterium]|nr:tetratricopeptide repeat protein [Burkholderiaceae bacterium]